MSICSYSIRSNTLLSSLPDVFTTNSKLESLDLSNTALTGLLPASLSFASNLKLLNLRDNNLDGQIPEFSQKYIEFVDLSGNNLIGGVPHSLAAHPSLLSLDARDNQLTSLPIEWTASVYDISDQAPFPLEQILLSGNDLQVSFRQYASICCLGGTMLCLGLGFFLLPFAFSFLRFE